MLESSFKASKLLKEKNGATFFRPGIWKIVKRIQRNGVECPSLFELRAGYIKRERER